MKKISYRAVGYNADFQSFMKHSYNLHDSFNESSF